MTNITILRPGEHFMFKNFEWVCLDQHNTDGGVLAKFDADGEYLDEEIEGTFEDFSMPESFANLTGFLTN